MASASSSDSGPPPLGDSSSDGPPPLVDSSSGGEDPANAPVPPESSSEESSDGDREFFMEHIRRANMHIRSYQRTFLPSTLVKSTDNKDRDCID
mgnify:CR=1 FL=1